MKKKKIDKKAVKRVKRAIKEHKELTSSKEIEKKAEEMARKYGVSKSDAMAYLRMQLRKAQRQKKLEHARKTLKKFMNKAQEFASRYEQAFNEETNNKSNKDQTGLTQYTNNIMKYWEMK